MDRVKPATPIDQIFAEVRAELDTIADGYVELRIYKSQNALENHDITTHKRSKGRIAVTSGN